MSVVQYIVRTKVNNDLWIVFTKYRPGKCSYSKESNGITIVQGTYNACAYPVRKGSMWSG